MEVTFHSSVGGPGQKSKADFRAFLGGSYTIDLIALGERRAQRKADQHDARVSESSGGDAGPQGFLGGTG